MAQRRMFSPQIVCSEEFLTMPVSSRELYFQLGMQADDDGFIQPKLIMKLTGAGDDDLKVLLAKRFLIAFDGGVVVIKHWLIHNLIQKDRYHETRFKEQKNSLFIKDNRAYTEKEKNNLKLESGIKKIPFWRENRKKIMSESSLPYSFSYKIRNAFWGKLCPICGVEMRDQEMSKKCIATIQHIIPLTKGGKHELDNIAVICHNCNLSLRDTPTEKLNNADVIKEWTAIVNQSLTEVRLGKVKEGKDNAEPSSADIVLLLDMFSILNPAVKRMYGNKTQRKACRGLIDTYGLERIKKIITETLPKTNGLQYFPTITTPLQLQDKFISLESAIRKYQSEKLSNNNKYPKI